MLLLDAAAGSYLNDDLLKAYCSLRRELPWNPHGVTLYSEKARREIARSQLRILDVFGLSEADFRIIWTSNGTEALNLAIGSFSESYGSPLYFCDACAHPGMIEPVRHYASRHHGSVRMIPVDSGGHLVVSGLDRSSSLPSLSCVCLINNETGTVQKADIIRTLPGQICLDVTQAIGKVCFDWMRTVPSIGCIAFSGRKLGMPVSIGALIVRKSFRLIPQIFGGGQQDGMRSGTLDAAAISVLASAVDREFGNFKTFTMRSKDWNCKLRKMLSEIFGERLAVFSPIDATPSILLAGIRGVEGALAARVLAEKFEILVGTGSACSAESGRTSHVLAAMGVPDDLARCAVRFSFPASFNAETAFPVLRIALEKLNAMPFVAEK